MRLIWRALIAAAVFCGAYAAFVSWLSFSHGWATLAAFAATACFLPILSAAGRLVALVIYCASSIEGKEGPPGAGKSGKPVSD